jgi:Leucine-rich repeat (LRR) protein
MKTGDAKTRVVVSLLALVGLLWLSPLAMAVDIPDLDLRTAVNQALGNRDPTQEPTEAQMLSLTELMATSRGIGNLTGLEYATNLTYYLYLYANQISELRPLSGLTSLTHLDLHSNQISELGPLSGLRSLTHLDLHSNRISQLEPLSGLTSLRELDLRGNPLNVEAYCTYLPMIEDNNPGINLRYDPNPHGPCPHPLVAVCAYRLGRLKEE